MNVRSIPEAPAKMTLEAYSRWVETQERRYELVDGVPRLQTYVKRNHNRITVNIVGLLLGSIDPEKFEIATGEFAVQTGPVTIRYADVMVEVAGGPGESRRAEEAVVLIEVLSDSTMHVDFGEKLQEYQRLSSLDTYLIVAQDVRRAWQWTRGEGGAWPAEPLHIDDEAATIEIASLKVRLPFSEVYRHVRLAR